MAGDLGLEPTNICLLAREKDVPARDECLDLIELKVFEEIFEPTHGQTPLAQVDST
jgi:hypothetical protein